MKPLSLPLHLRMNIVHKEQVNDLLIEEKKEFFHLSIPLPF